MYNQTKIKVDKLIFLDIDGCITSEEEGNYFSPDPSLYHPSKKIVSKLIDFCKCNNTKIIISSNWRKFDIDGVWKNSYGVYKNPLPETIQMLGDVYVETLPPERHVTKSDALIKWLNKTGYTGSFVIFDDDLHENYQNKTEFNIKDKFVFIDSRFGITDDNLKTAKNILDNKL